MSRLLHTNGNNMFSLAFGIGTQNQKKEWLEVYYPEPLINPSDSLIATISSLTAYAGGNQALLLNPSSIRSLAEAINIDSQKQILRQFQEASSAIVMTVLEHDSNLTSTPEAYLKLHLLSHRLVKPNEINLQGIFPLLPNVAWTNLGAIDLEEVEQVRIKARVSGKLLTVFNVDKFPILTNYFIPKGVRIADSARVRLGAYLGEGTTVMHEGFANFNAGCEGPNMIEGRISQGVMVGSGSDLGGSASTAGTLSGGGNTVISVGEDCLISANAGTGISLGDRCTIEAGLYITPGTLVEVLDEKLEQIMVAKARELSGQDDMLFIRHSRSGAVQCRTNRQAIQLNSTLHNHN